MSFSEVASAAGVRFHFDCGSRGRHDLPEIMGGGVAIIDADGDGRFDIYLCNGGPIDPRHANNDPPSRLFRNLGDGKFEDITALANAPGPSYAMGAAVGDYDDDGLDDLLVTGWQEQRLYHNLGDGRFEDVTISAGLQSTLWSTSAAFADLDADGDLDLYVANYADYDAAHAPFCAAPDGERDYCGPEVFQAQQDRLYRNNGDRTFTDISIQAGIQQPDGRGLGVLIADLVGDSKPDVFVANDGSPCWLFENRGDSHFDEVGRKAGLALDGRGQALAGMGVALGDLDGDGQQDLVVSNFHGRSTVAFRATKGGLFQDVSEAIGLTKAARDVLGFGLVLMDFDGDTHLDLFQANGHVLDRERLGIPFAMRPSLLTSHEGRFTAAPEFAGSWSRSRMLGRGVAVGDLDDDGRPDLVVNSLDAPAAILLNESTGGRFVMLDLIGIHPSPRSAIGARIWVHIGDRVLLRDIVGGSSYLSSLTRTVFFGLGHAERIDRLEIRWPSGRLERWNDLDPPPKLRLVEGSGRLIAARDQSDR